MNFRFLNIPVYISSTFWIFLLFFTNALQSPPIQSLILGVVLLFSLLVHEYGHALTARYFGAHPTITLQAFGGYAEYYDFAMTPKQRFLITLNGPLLESVLIVVPYALLKLHVFEGPYMRYFLYVMLRLNILWCVLNLIPISPLDGGKIADYFLVKKFGEKGRKIALIIGLACAVLIAPYLFYLGFFFFGALLAIFGIQNFQALMTTGNQNHFSLYNEATKTEDRKTLKKLLKSKNEHVRNQARESLAKIYAEQNNTQKAYDVLIKADPQCLKEGKYLLCKLAFQRGNYDLVGKYARDIYATHPSYDTALLISQAFAHLNHPEEAGGWLYTASRFEDSGDIGTILLDKAYDQVRHQESFAEPLNSL